ncbi:MAG: cobalt ABC transporter ATP-binding protein [Alphaproteobacteria bacterium]|nr:cobalt ABC transporter ATP-binding protein [Alphaproteobacteria bacterium]|tara:strand:+ start:4538 stop:5212 length:675 start_codon:yes stop_codon:yes gene_type:complete
MFEISNVSQRFGERHVLKDISLRIGERRVGVIGANGSGKSTFVRLLNGLLIPDEGTVTVDGIDTRTDVKAVRRKVGFVFQNPDNQIVFPVVEEDLEFGLKNLKLSKQEIASRIDSILGKYKLEHLRQSAAHLLSGGEKQMLAISAVLVMEPSYVVFDEPMTLLDLRNKKLVLDTIHAIEQPIILVTHDLEHLEEFERVIVFEDGQVVADGAPDDAICYYTQAMA